jgi:SAM-dependent methyltransferase
MTTAAFDSAAASYDVDFTDTRLGRWLRGRVWQHLDFAPGQRVLELGCGTGEDALFLARRGVSVLATDVSAGMLAEAERKAGGSNVDFALQDARNLSLEETFDGAFANFGVLNCVRDLQTFGARLPLRSGGRFVAVVMGPFCAWETFWYLAHGDARRASRRWRSDTVATIGGMPLPVWYPSPAKLRAAFSQQFTQLACEGLGTLLPPSYLSSMVNRWPELVARLDGRMPFAAAWADHYISVFERR